MLRIKLIVAATGLAALLAAGVSAQEPPAPNPGAAPGRGAGGDGFFLRNDANEDGKVTLEEMTAAAKDLITKTDADGDGAITPEELKSFHQKLRAENAEGEGPGPRGEGRRGPDGPPDGAGRRGGGRRGPGGPEGRNGDGPRGERPVPEEIFKKIDTDGDGQISLEEFKAAGEKRRENQGERRGPPPGRRGR